MVRGPVSMVIVGVLSLGMVALLFGGPRVFEKVLPASAIAWLETFGTDGTMQGIGDGGGFFGLGGTKSAGGDGADPMSKLRDRKDGWEADASVATLQGGGLAFVGDVLQGHSARVRDHAPAEVSVLTPVTGCRFTPPSAEAHIGHAQAAKGTSIGLATYNDSHIAEAVQVLVNVYRKNGTLRKATLNAHSYEVFDIAVTETARPVYLVLVGWHGLTVFNIHLAPGARIERVALIGGDQIGVANLDPAVPVEVLRGDEAAACGAVPFYPPNPGNLFFQSVENGAIKPEELPGYLERFATALAGWEGYFQANFGTGATQSLSGDVGGVLVAAVGPVPVAPEARAVWRPVKGAALRVTVDQYVEMPGAPEGQDFASVVEGVARAFAWGDLKNLSQGVEF